MTISSINSSVRNQYPQFNHLAASKDADADTAKASASVSNDAASSDKVNISSAGQAMASAATGFTAMLQSFDPGRALTSDDKALIGYPSPSNAYVTMMAATICELRESGAIQGRMTSEFFKLADGTQASVFDVMPKDAQSQVDLAPLKNRMMARFAEYKNGTADEVKKLANDNSLLNLDRHEQSLSSPKVKAMIRDYNT